MPTLRISASDDQWDVSLGDRDADVRTIAVPASTVVSGQDEKDLRWYFEDYLRYPYEPAPAIAARISARIQELGEQLFAAVFSSDATRRLWSRVEGALSSTRFEIGIQGERAEALPWELMKPPGVHGMLALHAESFVRIPRPAKESCGSSASASRAAERDGGEPRRMRLLVAICRPGGTDDVPYRSVARQLIRSATTGTAEIHVLRPAAFDILERRLEAAFAARLPYDVLHFDGHGIFEFDRASNAKRGKIIFENPGQRSNGEAVDESNSKAVDGRALGLLLERTGVRALILNACRSAYAEAAPAPVRGDPASNALALGSFAHEAAAAGVPAVVAMRYNVHVKTAADFALHFYAELVEGATAGKAVAVARRRMAEAPPGDFPAINRLVQDWLVPVIFEAKPVRLFDCKAMPPRREAAAASPQTEFVGRDSVILNLDRMFLDHSVVLLHSLAGDGKTVSAREFAAWCRQTGAVRPGHELYTSFAQIRTLAQLVAQLQHTLFKDRMRVDNKVPRLTRNGALRLLREAPMLWIWDDLDTLDLIPGALPAASESEKGQIARFLSDIANTAAKVLLLSARVRIPWLSATDVVPMPMPRMPLWELDELRRKLFKELGLDLRADESWVPLLRSAYGHPQALRVFVEQIAAGAGRGWPAAGTGRGQWPPASGEETAEAIVSGDILPAGDNPLHRNIDLWFRSCMKRPASWFILLHWFRDVVSPVDLQSLVVLPEGAGVPGVEQFATSCEPIETIFAHAADYGVLQGIAGDAMFRLHPGLASYLKSCADSYFPAGEKRQNAVRAYVATMGSLASHMTNLAITGEGQTRLMLRLYEANLLHAWKVAMQNGWLNYAVDLMQGIEEVLYRSGRGLEWRHIVDAVEPLVSAGEAADQRWVLEWEMVQEYRLRLYDDTPSEMRAERAARLHAQRMVDRPILVDDVRKTGREEQDAIRSRAVAIAERGAVMLEEGNEDCLLCFDEADALLEGLGSAALSARLLSHCNRAQAYAKLDSIRSFDKSEEFAQRAISAAREIGSAELLATAHLTLMDGRLEHVKALVARGATKQEYARPYREFQQALGLAMKYVLNAGSSSERALFYSLRGQWLDMRKQDELAIADFQRAIDLDPQSDEIAELRMRIAASLESLGRKEAAAEYRNSAKELARSKGKDLVVLGRPGTPHPRYRA